MIEWYSLPEKDGKHYFLKVVDVYRDEGLVVEYEIYRDEEIDPIQIDFFQDEIEKIIEEVKKEHRKEEREIDYD